MRPFAIALVIVSELFFHMWVYSTEHWNLPGGCEWSSFHNAIAVNECAFLNELNDLLLEHVEYW